MQSKCSFRCTILANLESGCNLDAIAPFLGCKFTFETLRTGVMYTGDYSIDPRGVVNSLGFLMIFTPTICAGSNTLVSLSMLEVS